MSERSRFVRPETQRLELSDGDYLIVKRRLTAGEQRAAFARQYISEGGVAINPQQSGGLAKVTAYLVDWNLTGLDGTPVEIRGRALDEVEAALNALDPDDFDEIRAAIRRHEAAMIAERAAEKKTRDGAAASPPISPSPVAAAGATSG